MKATIRPFLYTRRVKENGKYPVKLKVTYKREKKYFSVGVDLTEDEFKVFHLSKKLKKQFEDITYYLKKADTIIDDLKENFSWTEFEKRFFTSQQTITARSLNISTLLTGYSDQLNQEGRVKSSDSYKTTSNKLKTVFKKTILLTDVTPEFLRTFEQKMLSENLTYSSIGIYMRNIRVIFNQAIRDKLISSDYYPFGKNKYSPPTSRKAKKALTIEDIGKLYAYVPETKYEARAKDMWLFAYFANGMNVKDIALLKYQNIANGEINFFREKTINSHRDDQKEIRIILSDELKAIIKKWGNKKKQAGNYIFDIIKTADATPREKRRAVSQAIKSINKYMKIIAGNLKLERIPTTNYARHSFSTVLKRAGVSIEMISEQLGHSNIKTTEIYLDSFEKEQRKEIPKHLTAFKYNTTTTV
jgi:integrase/recombinase XerD